MYICNNIVFLFLFRYNIFRGMNEYPYPHFKLKANLIDANGLQIRAVQV